MKPQDPQNIGGPTTWTAERPSESQNLVSRVWGIRPPAGWRNEGTSVRAQRHVAEAILHVSTFPQRLLFAGLLAYLDLSDMSLRVDINAAMLWLKLKTVGTCGGHEK